MTRTGGSGHGTGVSAGHEDIVGSWERAPLWMVPAADRGSFRGHGPTSFTVGCSYRELLARSWLRATPRPCPASGCCDRPQVLAMDADLFMFMGAHEVFGRMTGPMGISPLVT